MSALPECDLEFVTEFTRDDWINRRNERFFITGASGFVGSWMLESLLHANERLNLNLSVVVCTRNKPALYSRYPRLVNSGVLSACEGRLETIEFPTGTFSHVVHLATNAHQNEPGRVGSSFFDDLTSSKRIAEFAVSAAVDRLLFTSSGAVYGRPVTGMSRFSEDYAGGPSIADIKTGYGQAKRGSEFMFQCLAENAQTNVVIARLFAFIGPRLPLSEGYAIGNFIRDAISDQPIVILSDGKPKRTYLYAGDLAAWLWRLLFRGPSRSVYNVGGSQDVSISELAHIVAATLAPSTPVVIKNARATTDGDHYVPDVSKARDSFGLREFTSLEEGIRKTANWHRRLAHLG
jgi:nucleoside-diphosphate-sugar epimerase